MQNVIMLNVVVLSGMAQLLVVHRTKDKFLLKGQNLEQVFNSRSVRTRVMHFCCYEAKLPNLKLKTLIRQVLSSLPLDVAFPVPGTDWT